jgi:hypothetical protein
MASNFRMVGKPYLGIMSGLPVTRQNPEKHIDETSIHRSCFRHTYDHLQLGRRINAVTADSCHTYPLTRK